MTAALSNTLPNPLGNELDDMRLMPLLGECVIGMPDDDEVEAAARAQARERGGQSHAKPLQNGRRFCIDELQRHTAIEQLSDLINEDVLASSCRCSTDVTPDEAARGTPDAPVVGPSCQNPFPGGRVHDFLDQIAPCDPTFGGLCNDMFGHRGRVHEQRSQEHQAFDACVDQGRAESRQRTGTETHDDERLASSFPHEPIDRLDRFADGALLEGQIVRTRLAIANPGVIEPERRHTQTGQLARQVDVQAARADAVHDAGIQEHDGNVRSSGTVRRRIGHHANQAAIGTEHDGFFSEGSVQNARHHRECAVNLTAGRVFLFQ